jgi:hypothetical protein
MRANRGFHLIVLVVVVVCCATGVALAATLGDATPSREEYESGQRATPVTAVSTAQTSTFSILARPQDTSDRVPAESAAQVEASGTFKGLFGASVSLARKADGFASGAAWVVPGDDSVCLIAASTVGASGVPQQGMPGGATCAKESGVAAGQLYLLSGSEKAPGKQFIAGIAPNGVSGVQLELSDNSTMTVPVHENVYMALVAEEIASVSFERSSGGVVKLEHVGP